MPYADALASCTEKDASSMANPSPPPVERSPSLYDLTNAITVAWGTEQLIRRRAKRGRFLIDPRLQLSLDAMELALAEAAVILRAIKTA